MLVVLTVLVCATGTLGDGFLGNLSNLGNIGNLGDVGADIGGQVGSGIGKGLGNALETGIKVPGIGGGVPNILPLGGGNRPTDRPAAVRPPRVRNDKYSGGDSYGRSAYEGGSGSSDRRYYEKQGSSKEFERGRSYAKESPENERENRVNYEPGRGGQGGSGDRYEGRPDNYGREGSNYDKRYENAHYDGERGGRFET